MDRDDGEARSCVWINNVLQHEVINNKPQKMTNANMWSSPNGNELPAKAKIRNFKFSTHNCGYGHTWDAKHMTCAKPENGKNKFLKIKKSVRGVLYFLEK